MRLLPTLVVLPALFVAGCGGGEDFSAPPPGLAAQRQKSRDKPAAPEPPAAKKPDAASDQEAKEQSLTTLQKIAAAGKDGAAAEADGEQTSSDAVATGDARGAAAAATGTDAATPVGENLISGEPAAPGAAEPAMSKAGATPSALETAAASEGEKAAPQPADAAVVDTGDSVKPPATQPALQKPEKPEKTGGLSFLDTLKSDRNKKAGRPGRVIESTGRLAVSLRVWQQLKLLMSRRFFIAATDDATRIAGSTGERQLSVLSTRVEQRHMNAGPAVATLRRTSTTDKDERTIAALPAVINSLELLDGGDLVLIGTEDGRLMARSAADLVNWDVYARDLFAFQDEYRASTRISDSGIVAIRQLNAEQVVTVDGDNLLQIWKTDAIVQPPKSPLEMTADDLDKSHQPAVSATPIASVQLSDSQLFSITVSASGTLLGVVTDDEVITVVDPADGRVVTSLNADSLDDTQPVAVAFDEAQQQIYVGLADGRVARRALPGGTAVRSTTDEGLEVDYEMIFTPQQNARGGAVTALAMTADGGSLYFGRFDGSVSKYDVPRRQLAGTRKLHSKAVVDIRLTPNGVLSMGDGRVAQLTELPVRSGVPPAQRQTAAATSERFTLPADPSLPSQVAAREDESADRSTRPRNPNVRQQTQPPATAAELGIRPVDPQLAMLHHQLRVAPADQVDEVRSRILEQRGDGPVASPAVDSESPRRLGEITSQIEFGARITRPVVMTVSNDGKLITYVGQGTVAPAVRSGNQQSVIAVDVPTGTTLRSWDGLSSPPDALDASWEAAVVLPRPLQGRMHLLTGALTTEADLLPLGQFAWSYDRRNILAARTGITGQALDTFTLQTPDGQTLKNGVESFEGAVGAIAYSADGSTIFASIREKARIRLLELDAQTLAIVNDLASEPMTGAWNVERVTSATAIGPVQIVPSPGGRLLVTYGRHNTKFHLRFWKKSGTRWPQDQVTVIDSSSQMLATNTDRPFVFVNQKDNLLAVIGAEGIGTIDTRSGDVKDRLPVPDVNGRRPVILFTPDGRFALSGDGEGNIWVAELRSLDRRPKKFVAQAGEITGMVLSQDGTKLATAGRENRIRVWDLEGWLYEDQKTASK
ncbi:MAG: hypothetical protein NXI04_13970 [Planctomycetaceae bacterium]|nr:hypothetical protein [Planctomycetaceae bacterium]